MLQLFQDKVVINRQAKEVHDSVQTTLNSVFFYLFNVELTYNVL
jgi:hypothetical protein